MYIHLAFEVSIPMTKTVSAVIKSRAYPVGRSVSGRFIVCYGLHTLHIYVHQCAHEAMARQLIYQLNE